MASSLETRLDQIGTVPMFQGLDTADLANLAAIAVERRFKRNETVFSEGEPGAGFHICITGRVKIFKVSTEGKEQILHVFGPGEPFGEVPVFEGGRYPAGSAAIEPCQTLYFPRDTFVDLVAKNPELSLHMLAVLSKRLRRFATLIEDLSLKEVPGRLAAHLLQLSKQANDAENAQLEMSKAQLASLLGTIPETLSRVLSRMTAEGLIRQESPRTIVLMDRDGLEDLAHGTNRLA